MVLQDERMQISDCNRGEDDAVIEDPGDHPHAPNPADTPLIMGDGTFGIAPAIFTQLYTLHAYKNDRSIACAYALH